MCSLMFTPPVHKIIRSFSSYSAADNKAEITGETESESVYVMGLVSHIKDTNDEHRSQSEDTQLTNPRQLRGSSNG